MLACVLTKRVSCANIAARPGQAVAASSAQAKPLEPC